MFPSRPRRRRPNRNLRLLATGTVFGPPPGPANATGNSQDVDGVLPTDGMVGYGDMPYGDHGDEVIGVNNENPSIVGVVIRVSQYHFVAERTNTWGGTTFISASLNEARKFIEDACGQSLRQEETQLGTGQQMFRYYNPVYENLLRASGEGFGD